MFTLFTYGESLIRNNENYKDISLKTSKLLEKTKNIIEDLPRKTESIKNKVINKLESAGKSIENRLEETFYESGMFYKDNILYLPLNKETILIYLKKNSTSSIFLKDEKLLDLHLKKLYEMLDYLPLPIFEVGIKNNEEETLNFIEKFGRSYDRTFKYLSIFLSLILMISISLEDFNSEKIYNNKYFNLVTNGSILLILNVFFPSKIFYLNNKIKALFYGLHLILLSKNSYYYYNVSNKNGFFKDKNVNILFLNNLFFSIINILYINYYPCEYKKIKRKVEKLQLVKKNTPMSVITEIQGDDYGLPAGNIPNILYI